jgi:alpha-galactosidase
MRHTSTIRAAGFDFVFSVEAPEDLQPDITLEVSSADAPNTHLLRWVIEAAGTFNLTDLSVEWAVPATDMHGMYWGGNPTYELAYLPFWNVQKHVASNTGVPYIALIHRSGENRAAFGSFDQLTETSLTAELSEADRTYHFRLSKPDYAGQTLCVNGRREEIFFVSNSHQTWSDVLQNYVCLSDAANQPAKLPVPAHAFDPVFCTWTAIHHQVSHDWIMHNARIAADLGFRTWITDDGWFTDKGRFADYRYTGDWQPFTPKFPDMKAHVNAVQALGFHYILWLSPFMVGDASEAAQRYAHLLTGGREHLFFKNLSPQRPETRQIVGDLVERLVRDYDLDGLKIDFIDSVFQKEASTETFGASLYEVLLEATERARVHQPELLVEFRNPYSNLASRSYSNIYRSSDVPLNYTLNRWQAIMLRLLAPDRAVHLDPALWHDDETDENVAVHLINVIVSVPMISVELDRYPQSHLDLIRYWIGFYNAHRDTIVHGEFKPTLALGHVPQITFKSERETIIGLYEDVPIALSSAPVFRVLNASTRPYVDFEPSSLSGIRQVITRDKFGKVVSDETCAFPTARLSVEVGGSLEIRAAH